MAGYKEGEKNIADGGDHSFSKSRKKVKKNLLFGGVKS